MDKDVPEPEIKPTDSACAQSSPSNYVYKRDLSLYYVAAVYDES